MNELLRNLHVTQCIPCRCDAMQCQANPTKRLESSFIRASNVARHAPHAHLKFVFIASAIEPAFSFPCTRRDWRAACRRR
jgi:hypothetical protein